MEKQQDKNLDNIFKSQFDGFELEPSEKVWIGVQHELDRSRDVNRKVIRARWAVAASILFCIISTTIYLMQKPALQGQLLTTISDLGDKGGPKSGRVVIIQSPNTQQLNKQVPKTQNINPEKGKSSPQKRNKKAVKQVHSEFEVEEHLVIVNPLPFQHVEQIIAQSEVENSPKVKESMLATALAQNKNDEYLIEEENSLKIDVVEALDYVASKVDKRDKRFLAINKKKGFSLNLGILKVEKKVNYKDEEE